MSRPWSAARGRAGPTASAISRHCSRQSVPKKVERLTCLLPGGADSLSHAAKTIDVVTEADIGVARAFVVAIPGAAVIGTESPRATAQHFVLTFVRTFGILAGSLLVIVHLVEVVAPFPHVAGHVVESPRIRLLQTDWPGMSARVLVKPRVVAQFCGAVSEEIRGRGAGPAGILPLGLGRQPVSICAEI